MIEFLHIGFDSYVCAGKIKMICQADNAKIKKELQRRKLDKGSPFFSDASCGKEPKALLILDDGMLVVSAIAAETLIKRISENNFKEEK